MNHSYFVALRFSGASGFVGGGIRHWQSQWHPIANEDAAFTRGLLVFGDRSASREVWESLPKAILRARLFVRGRNGCSLKVRELVANRATYDLVTWIHSVTSEQ